MPRRPASADPSLPIIARNLRAIRTDLKQQQGDVAVKAGVPRGQLNRWENGRQKPEVDALLKLAIAYECSVEDFLAGVNEAYDLLVERGIGVNVRRHYQARHAEVKQLAMQAIAAITDAVGTSPTPAAPGASPAIARGIRTPARARRQPKKK